VVVPRAHHARAVEEAAWRGAQGGLSST
jgi:hypothetical protein